MDPQSSRIPIPSPRDAGIPPRLVPILYFATAHLSLIAASSLLVADAGELAGFFYQPRMVAVVHLITLGWITASILGSLYVIGPMGLRTAMPGRPADTAAWAMVTVGIAGFFSHAWINSYGGVGWSGLLLMLGLLHVGAKALRGLRRAPLPNGVKAHFLFAFLNVAGAGTLGILLGFDKRTPFLPARELGNVFAHAHLAAIGWAAMTVIGAGYRMLPMLLPAAMPTGRSLLAGAWILEAGTVGLFISLLLGSGWAALCALAVAAGLGIFLANVGWMARHPRPGPAGRLRPDYGVLHAGMALACLVLAAAAGIFLAAAPPSEATLRLAPAYGVVGLLGFLSQMVVGVEARILPMFASYHANRNACGTVPVLKPADMPVQRLQAAAFFLWLAAVPALAAGFALPDPRLVAAGGGCLLTAALLGAANTAVVLSHAYRRPSGTMRGSENRPDGR